jgi:hypothetical protein
MTGMVWVAPRCEFDSHILQTNYSDRFGKQQSLIRIDNWDRHPGSLPNNAPLAKTNWHSRCSQKAGLSRFESEEEYQQWSADVMQIGTATSLRN